MSGRRAFPDPLEAWKKEYNATGSGSIESLARLAHLSRWIADYGERSADAHLVLFALTRDSAYHFRALELAGALPSDAGALLDLFELGAPVFTAALARNRSRNRWRTALLRGDSIVRYSRALETIAPVLEAQFEVVST